MKKFELQQLKQDKKNTSSSEQLFLKSINDFSANVLIQEPCSLNQQWLCIFLPVYVRLDILRFQELAVTEQKAVVSAKVYFDLDVTKLPDEVVDAIIKNMKWHLLYQESQIWDFNDEQSDHHQKIEPLGKFEVDGKQMLRYNFENKFQARAITNIVWTPFQVTRLIISLRIETIQIQRKEAENIGIFKAIQKHINGKTKGLSIKFNAMDYRYDLQRVTKDGKLVGDMAQIMYNHDVSVGLYELGQRIMSTQNTNNKYSQLQIQIGKEIIEDLQQSCWVTMFQRRQHHAYKPQRNYQQEDQIESEKLIFSANHTDCFNNVHFILPLGRRPLVSIFELMIPGYILGLISLVTYFQSGGQDGLADRVGSIATVMLAYIALQPVIRSQIPAEPKLSIVEVVGYLQILITVLCLVESFVGTVREDYQFIWYTNPFFLISLIIQVFATFMMGMAIGTYYTVWIAKYSIKTGMRIPFKPCDWHNPSCDKWLLLDCIANQQRNIQKM